MNPNILNIAAIHLCTHALGPGKRAAVWVQGCPFSCPGCIAPSWQDARPATLIEPDYLASQIAKQEDLRGLTLSGGEPMQQAEGLLAFVQAIRDIRDMDVICFTGYKIESLYDKPPNPFVVPFLQVIDVLIDGLYIEALNNDRGLRGSKNQRIHHLTDRIKDFDFEKTPRKVEVVLNSRESFLVGVPTNAFLKAYDGAFEQMQEKFQHVFQSNVQIRMDKAAISPQEVIYERS